MQNIVYEPPHEAGNLPVQTDRPRINVLFPRSLHGILKIVELVLTFITFICIASAGYTVSTTGWLNFVAASTFVMSLLFFLLYMFHLIGELPGPWVIIEFAVLTVSSFLFILSMIIAAASTGYSGGRIATALFFAFTGVAYAIECLVRFRVYKDQGQFVISSTNVNTARRAPGGDVPPASAVGNNSVAAALQQPKSGSLRPDYIGQDEYVMP